MKSVYAVLNTDWVGPEAGQVFQRPSRALLCEHVSQANSFKAYWLWECLDCVKDSLLATAAKKSPRVEAT